MWNITNLTKAFMAPEESDVIIKVDPNWGFSEFPQPGDVKKHTLPILIDHEIINSQLTNSESDYQKDTVVDTTLKEFWMPDRFCKVCYGCEESFTMYRRRHHCRMCGQIFCNNCSSFYIDGMLFNIPGLVRACRLCYDQLFERTERETKVARRKLLDKMNGVETTLVETLASPTMRGVSQSMSAHHGARHRELSPDDVRNHNNLQNRASAHFIAVVERLVASSNIATNRSLWKDTISTLVKEVVSSVDPDVRGGDGMDIRQYVKIKIIPGGAMDESIFVDGVVFRKNVSHKKMAKAGTKTNPRILLLAGGIEFQRTDTKLSSMDTLIEQEDKYMEILVEKIMSLKPDIILVGKAVARKAQELLCEHKVVVMQNVKIQLLERIGRMTGAMLLPSTDHMIKQFGEECLGTCGQFLLRVVQDDPEKNNSTQAAPRILRTRISRGSTYAYITGCPSERGCTIVLRGDNRDVLSEVKRIIEFTMVVAYHLRLEVAYYNDRYAELPMQLRDEVEVYDDGSDLDDVVVDSGRGREETDILMSLIDKPSDDGSASPPASRSKVKRVYGDMKDRVERYFLSTSLDVDISLPYSRELVGTQLFHNHNKPHTISISSAEQHQTLLITSLLMHEGAGSVPVQKASAEVKGIKYYTKQDIALGQFIIDNCFQLSRYVNRGESRMLDQTLSFIHRPGRIDITVRKHDLGASSGASDESSSTQRDPLRLPIFMTSFCKECRRTVTPLTMMSEETWKMSFGKFLEMFFYNRTARCRVNNCNHVIRDCHVLSFQCEGYIAEFDFIPLHAFALHVREGMQFPEEFHNQHTSVMLKSLPQRHVVLLEDFKMAIVVLEREIKEMLSSRPEDLALAMTDITMMETEINAFSTLFAEELLATFLRLPKKMQDSEVENFLRAQLSEKALPYGSSGRLQPLQTIQEAVHDLEDDDAVDKTVQSTVAAAASVVSSDAVSSIQSTDVIATAIEMSPEALEQQQTVSPQPLPDFPSPGRSGAKVSFKGPGVTSGAVATAVSSNSDFNEEIALRFPMYHMRDTFVKASQWNSRIDTIYRFLESVRHMLIQQQQLHSQNPAGIIGGDLYAYEEEYNEARKPLEALHYQHHAQISASFSGTAGGESVMALSPLNEDSPPPPSQTQSKDFGSSTQYGNSLIDIADSMSAHPTMSSKTTVTDSKKITDKPVDKMSRVTKIISKLMGNKESTNEEHGKFQVPLGDFGEGRYGLRPGRKGEVIPVHEDEFATIIAYSLASEEYHENLQLSLKEDYNDSTDYDAHFHAEQDIFSNKKAAASDDLPKAQATLRKQLSTKTSSFLAGKDGKMDARQQQQQQTQQDEDNDIDNDGDENDMMSGAKDSGNNSPTPYNIEGSEVERAFAKVGKDSQFIKSGNLFNAGGSAALFNQPHETAIGHADLKSPITAEDDCNVCSGDDTDNAAAHTDGSEHIHSHHNKNTADATAGQKSTNEKQMISQNKSYIRHRFNDLDNEGNTMCKFQCQIYWAKQFEAVRSCYFGEEDNQNFIRSLSMSSRWVAQGGKSGAAFSKTMDDRLVIKVISRVELQMFLEFAPAYFEYMAKAYYHSLPTVLCKILGVFTVRYHNKETGKKIVENVVVMENIFYQLELTIEFTQRNITRTFDLKGSSRARYVDLAGAKGDDFDEALLKRRRNRRQKAEGLKGAAAGEPQRVSQVLLDDNLMELTRGRPFPLKHRAKLFFHKAVLNDTLFLSIVNVVDYSILVGFDETSHEIVVGIIDYMRQYDIIKKMERMGKSVGMLTGQAEPTIIQPSQYRKRFSLAMERYFMTVPDKWVSHDS